LKVCENRVLRRVLETKGKEVVLIGHGENYIMRM
jgi:hypothetical protein